MVLAIIGCGSDSGNDGISAGTQGVQQPNAWMALIVLAHIQKGHVLGMVVSVNG